MIPLGGVGEIGKNLLVLEYDKDILVIDAGLMFPENDMLGHRSGVPRHHLSDRSGRPRAGIVLTHGHEDHIGALPYLLKYLDVPVYATPLTRGLAEVKLKEAGLLADSELHTITPDDVLELGCFPRRVLPRLPQHPRRGRCRRPHAGGHGGSCVRLTNSTSTRWTAS